MYRKIQAFAVHEANLMKKNDAAPFDLLTKAQTQLELKEADKSYNASMVRASYEEMEEYHVFQVTILFGELAVDGVGTTIEMAVDTAIQFYEVTQL